METVYEGWLKKSQSEKKLFRPKTSTQKSNQRWFVLKHSGDIPGQYILDYFTDSTCKKQKGRVDLDQCKKIDRKIDAIKPDEYLFSIETTKRTYNLLAQSKAELNKWIQCLCTVCGFKPNQPDARFLLSEESTNKFNKQENKVIVISYSNPNLLIDNNPFNRSQTTFSTRASLSSNQSDDQLINNQQTNNQLISNHLTNNNLNSNNQINKDKKLVSFDSTKWTTNSSTLRATNKTPSLSFSSNGSFGSATLPIKKSNKNDFSSGYIPISECHTGKSIFEQNLADIKNPTNEDEKPSKIIKFKEKFDGKEQNLKIKINDSNKENKFIDLSHKNQSLLDSSINSNQGLFLNLNSRSSNLTNDDTNYDVPRQIKIYKKSKIQDLLSAVPSPPTARQEIVYANAKSLPRNLNRNYNNVINIYLNTNESVNQESTNQPKQSNNNLVNNYINSIELERHRGSLKEHEYYNNIPANEQPNFNLSPPVRPPKPRSIIISKSTSLNSLNAENSNSNEIKDLNEFDPLNSVPKPPTNNLASSLDLMYSIPKTRVELELEKQSQPKNNSPKNSCLDTVVPLTYNRLPINETKDELHWYTNAATDVCNKSGDSQILIYDYEKPIILGNSQLNNLNDNHLDNPFKVPPTFKFNDKVTEPMTPSLIVTSTPLFLDQTERHFNFNDQDEDIFNKPQVNRDLKPKKSDTSIESFLMCSGKSPNNRNSDTLTNRANLNSSFNLNSSLTNSNSPPRMPPLPSRGRQFFCKTTTTNLANLTNSTNLENEQINEDAKSKKIINKKKSDYKEIQYLDLDLDCDNISLNSTINEASINSNFKDADKELNGSFINGQSNQFNHSFNTKLNYSHFVFSNKQDTTISQLNNTLNSSFTNPSTVYKTVDFIKTRAFNELKDVLNRKPQD